MDAQVGEPRREIDQSGGRDRPVERADERGRHTGAHHGVRVGSSPDRELGDRVLDRPTGVGPAVPFAGRDDQHDVVGAGGDRALGAAGVQRDRRPADVGAARERSEQFLRAGHLRDPLRVHERRDLEMSQSGRHQVFCQLDAACDLHVARFVLQAVPQDDVVDDDVGHLRSPFVRAGSAGARGRGRAPR
jgi:hypothetical protein